MKQYLNLLRYVLDKGTLKEDRTGTGTISTFGYQMRFDLSSGFPLATTKKVHLKSIIHELLWFLSGSTNISYLRDHNVKIWDNWADLEGNLGPVYGRQWRSFEGVDQIDEVVQNIKSDPFSRRHVVSAWNAKDLPDMALAPCHCLFQFYVNDGKLSCQLYQRSVDAFLGLAFNIPSYALLTMMIAQQCDLELGEFIHTSGDVHIYNNHIQQVKLQLSREPKPLPHMTIKKAPSIFEYKYEDFQIVGYDPHPVIKASVSV